MTAMPIQSKKALMHLLFVFGLGFSSLACQTEDTGRCCETLITDASTALPTPEFTGDGGIPRNQVGQHPAFDCESLTCVSWQGSQPFCTRKCTESRPCPQGFDCKPVLESSAGEGASIQPSDTFCVRRTCNFNADCPEEFVCAPIQEVNADSESAPRHCIRTQNTCK